MGRNSARYRQAVMMNPVSAAATDQRRQRRAEMFASDIFCEITAATAIEPVHHPADVQCGRMVLVRPARPKKTKIGMLVQTAKRSASLIFF